MSDDKRELREAAARRLEEINERMRGTTEEEVLAALAEAKAERRLAREAQSLPSNSR